jgi:hypothetical protein
LEKNSSNSAWVKREDCVSVGEGGAVGGFSEMKPKWGKQDERRNKIIPTDKILYIIKISPKGTNRFGAK